MLPTFLKAGAVWSCWVERRSRKKPYQKTTTVWTREQLNYLCVFSDQEPLASICWMMTSSQVLSFVSILANCCINISSLLLLHIAVLCFPLLKLLIWTPNVGGETNKIQEQLGFGLYRNSHYLHWEVILFTLSMISNGLLCLFDNHGPVWYPRPMEAFVSIQLEKNESAWWDAEVILWRGNRLWGVW